MKSKAEIKPAKLTTKQRKLVKGIAEGKTQKRAAIDAGYSPKTAQSIASQELNKTNVKATLLDLMEQMGLSDSSLLSKHKELLNAQKQMPGIDPIEVPDHAVQVKALEMAYKLKGAFVEKKEITGADGGAITITVSDRPKLTREEWIELHGIA